jgi:SAM-dependent methyltransferase
MLSKIIHVLRLSESNQIKDLDDPHNIYYLRRVIQRKPFLRNVYLSFYKVFTDIIALTLMEGDIIELGSGAGFLKKIIPTVITSDIIPYEGVDLVFSGLEMPFKTNSTRAFLMIDVLHHIKDSRLFFKEMQRCLKIGGKIVMIEPANTWFSRFIYTKFHHEPFEPLGDWGFEEGGPLSGANMAIPYIIFDRDIKQFIQEFPDLRIDSITLHTPFRYLLSGGLSFRQLLPSWSYNLVLFLESLLSPFSASLGMFMTIELKKIESD